MNKLDQLKALLPRKKSKAYYAKKLGISELELNELFVQLQGYKPPKSTLTTVSTLSVTDEDVNFGGCWTDDIKEGKAELTQNFTEPIKTLEELIERCDIDTSIWNITKYVQNFWGSGTDPHYQVKAFLAKKTIDNDLQAQKDLILKTLKEEKVNLRFSASIKDANKWFFNPNREAD